MLITLSIFFTMLEILIIVLTKKNKVGIFAIKLITSFECIFLLVIFIEFSLLQEEQNQKFLSINYGVFTGLLS